MKVTHVLLAVVLAGPLGYTQPAAGALSPPVGVASTADGLGSKMAVVTDRQGRDAPDSIYVMNADGSDERRVTFATAGNPLFPAWSPNGEMLAFQHNPDPQQPLEVEIFLINADGTELRQLTHMTDEFGLVALNPAWSPNGQQIAFNTAPTADLYVINLDGTGLTRLTAHPGNDGGPDWSPNGQYLAFNSNRDGDAEIYVMPAKVSDDGGGTPDEEPIQITRNSAVDIGADWSPNGHLIAYESNLHGTRDIYVIPADTTPDDDGTPNDPVQLTDTQPPTPDNPHRLDAFPSWSPNGQQIAFHRQVVQLPPPLAAPNGSEIFVIAADGSGLTQITHHTPDSFTAFVAWVQGHPSRP